MRTDGRTDGRTDKTKLIVNFPNFANSHKYLQKIFRKFRKLKIRPDRCASVSSPVCLFFFYNFRSKNVWPAVARLDQWRPTIWARGPNLSLLAWTLLPTHCRCRRLMLHLVTLKETHSVGLLCTRDRPFANISTSLETRNLYHRAVADLCLRLRVLWDRR